MNIAPVLLLLIPLLGLAAYFRPEQTRAVFERAIQGWKDLLDRAVTSLGTARQGLTDRLTESLVRVPEESGRHGLIHELIGVLLLAGTSTGVLLGDGAVTIETVCGMMGQDCSEAQVFASPAIAVAVALLAGAAFWAMILMDLYGITRWRAWPTHWAYKVIAWGMFILSISILTAAGIYRDSMITVAMSGAAAGAGETGGAAIAQHFVIAGGTLLVALSTAVALVGLASLLEVLLIIITVVPAVIVVAALALLFHILASGLEVILGVLIALIELLRRSERDEPPPERPRGRRPAAGPTTEDETDPEIEDLVAAAERGPGGRPGWG